MWKQYEQVTCDVCGKADEMREYDAAPRKQTPGESANKDRGPFIRWVPSLGGSHVITGDWCSPECALKAAEEVYGKWVALIKSHLEENGYVS